MLVVVDISGWLYDAMMGHRETIYSQYLGDAVRDGILLDDVKTKIKQSYCIANNDYDKGRNYGLYIATQILDDIRVRRGINEDNCY